MIECCFDIKVIQGKKTVWVMHHILTESFLRHHAQGIASKYVDLP